MPKLFVGVELTQQRPENHPNAHRQNPKPARAIQEPCHRQWRNKPNPSEHIPDEGLLSRQGVTIALGNFQMPRLHGQCVAFMPKKAEIKRQNQKNKCLKTEAVVHSVPRLCQRAKKIACNEYHTKKQHPFIKPTAHSPHQRCAWQAWLGMVSWVRCKRHWTTAGRFVA